MKLEQLSLVDTYVQDFISQNSKCFFSSVDWYKVLEESFNSKVVIYGLRDQKDLKLIIVGILLDFKIIEMFYSNVPYGGFIGEKEYVPYFVPFLEKELKRTSISVLRVCKQFTDDYGSLDGYKLQSGCQQIINIEGLSERELWNGYKKRVRRDIRRAEKLGVQIKEISARKDIEILYQLYQETMKRNRACMFWPKRLLYSIYDNLVLKDKAGIIFCSLDDKYIAGIILIYSEDTIYYFMGTSATDYLTYCPNDLLLHRTIMLGIRKSKKYVDLMTSDESDIELIRFKEKWGAKCYPFYIFEKKLNCIRGGIWACTRKIAASKIGAYLFNLVCRK
jgi:lipid II:glycine glycyltransferase (peptidoglycan interpeptide bridge formation enzyme)